MRICILANPRTGSSSLFELIKNHLPNDYYSVSEPFNPVYMKTISDERDHLFEIKTNSNVLIKHIYYQIPDEFKTMDSWLDFLFKNFDKIILLDRKNRLAQAESFVYHELQNKSTWHLRQVYDLSNVDVDLIETRIGFLNSDGESLKSFSEKYPIYYYEDIFEEKNIHSINSILEYINIQPNQKHIMNHIMSDSKKIRIPLNKRTLL